jgi:hypothetical protein
VTWSALDDVVSPIAVDLLTCLTTIFGELDDLTGDHRRPVCLRAGQRTELLASTTQDECCNRLVWCRWDGMWPSSQTAFPQVDNRVSPCGTARWATRWELGASRCAPIGTAQTLPTCDQWIDVSSAALEDAAALRRAVCCYQQLDVDRLVYIGEGRPMSTEGGCIGSTIIVTIAADVCDCIEGTS